MQREALPRPVVWFALFLCIGSSARAQTVQSVLAPTAGTVLSSLTTAFSEGKAVHQITLTGNATWTAGSSKDSGSVNLTASSSGPSEMQLSLSTLGNRIESQTGFGSNMSCQWTDKTGVQHSIDGENCWRPMLWFLPAFSLQSFLIPSGLGVTDLGLGAVGSGEGSYRHLQSQLVLGDLPMSLTKEVMRQSTTDLGLDSTTYLPAVLAYKVRPDSRGATSSIAIEVRYTDYQVVDGVEVPFHIQRYVNGSLQVDITVSSAQIN